ncbi:TonB-dependent receptor [Sphingomonas jatrophae]|uniref:Iron complex outermembrane recepter protein n=1 Tax=Sphingomonas jatrophae TaxID=1166337 RepID=A0A1I6KBQ7_9SPHN|nr:TonB-dependent receptor [Sphingomonas jatrophae]SFR88725.1 iron complex outermembrane recepter protein [Sphingomonas jatrophae]
MSSTSIHAWRALAGALLAIPAAATAQSTTDATVAAGDTPSPAEAAAPPAAEPATAPLGTGDIVVTARRRAENLQDVPVAITAFTGAALEVRNIRDITALDGLAPNVKVVESGSNTTTYLQIRGSVTTNPNPGYEPAAAMYIDGVYIGKAVGSSIDIAEIDHIEVLRGPQGTLFGRNTLAGAVSIVTRKPSGELGGTLKAGIGNYDRRLLQGSLDLPAFGPFSVTLAGLWSDQNGYIRTRANPVPQIPGPAPTVKRLGDKTSYAGRLAVRFRPSDTLTFDYSGDYSRLKTTPMLGVLQGIGAGGIFDPASPAYVGVPLGLYVQTERRPRDYYGTGGVDGAKLFEGVKTWTHALTGTLEVGEATLKSITAYRTLKWKQQLDLDGSPLPLAAAASNLDYKQFSQELQASGKAGRLFYTAGLYYFYDDGDSNNPQQFFGTTLERLADFNTDAYAAYAQVDWTPPILNDKLVLTAGYRYSKEKKRVLRGATAGGFTTIPFGTRASRTFSGSTPTFVAKYDLTDDINIYAKYSEGFKSGGFATDASTVQSSITPYDPETVDSIEIGTKARLLDGRLRVNLAAFFDKHKDQQIAVFQPTSAGFVTLVTNDARSQINGFEAEVQATPVDGLVLSANAGYTDAEFREFFAVVGGPNVARDRAFAFVPKWIASGSADITLLKHDDLQINLAGDLKYTGRYAALPYSTVATDDPNIFSTQTDSQTTLDARIVASRIPVGSGTIAVTGFVRNLFNEVSRTAGIDFGQAFGNIVTRNYNWPRTYGLDVSFRF